MKNNGISYADRKRISLKIERNYSMNTQSNIIKKEQNNINRINYKINPKRVNSYKEQPNYPNQEKDKGNPKIFKKVNLNNESLKTKILKPIKNIHSIPTLKYIDININNIKKIMNNKSSIDYDDYIKKEKIKKKNLNINNDMLNQTLNKKKKMNNSYCSSNKDINKMIKNANNNFISVTSKSSRKCEDILLVQDEILELKLINSRCNNEIIILKEKNNSLKEIIDMKDKEIQMIKNKYIQMIEDENNEKIKLKQKSENEFKIIKKNYEISIKTIKSLIETVIELTETLIFTEKNHNYQINGNGYKNSNNFNQISCSGVGECSLDIYESNINFDNNKEDEKDNKKHIILEQIKEIIIEKINNIIYKLNLVFDSSLLDKIERINNWNFHNFNMKYSPNYSLNLNNYPKKSTGNINNTNNLNDELFSGSLSKYNMSLNNEVSNDFDFSVSKSFYNPSSNISASPKFNRSIKVDNNYINTNENKNVKSLLFSFDEASKINIVNNNNKLNNTGNNNLNLNNNNIFNILEYSMVDLINSGDYANSNVHNIININNTVNNNNFTESKEKNFKGFYESFSNSNSKNLISSKKRIINEKNNQNLFRDIINDKKKENKENNNNNIKENNQDIENSDIGNITLKDIEQ